MRVLIVDAGIAGLTLSALLRQKGIKPQIVNRASDFAQAPRKSGRASATRLKSSGPRASRAHLVHERAGRPRSA
jgi:2-polyprenyl-6-methoxyphenol hydroxylase-like FAD-dependent oxidoreductase